MFDDAMRTAGETGFWRRCGGKCRSLGSKCSRQIRVRAKGVVETDRGEMKEEE